MMKICSQIVRGAMKIAQLELALLRDDATLPHGHRETSRDALLEFIVSTEKMVCMFTFLVY